MKNYLKSISMVCLCLMTSLTIAACGGNRSCDTGSTQSGMVCNNTVGFYTDDRLIEVTQSVPEMVSLGEEFQMTISLQALKPAAEIMVRDHIPEGASYVRSSPEAMVDGQNLVWKFDNMQCGECREITVCFKADSLTCLSSCAVVSALPMGCVCTKVGQAVLCVNKSCPCEVKEGEDITFDITVQNIGDMTAYDVVLTDSFPNSLAHESGVTGSVEQHVGDLCPGESATVPITFCATTRGNICNSVTAEACNAAQVSDEACCFCCCYELDVTKTGDSELYIGQKATYTLTVLNPGNKDLTGVQLVDNVPAPAYICDAPGACVDGNTATWTMDVLKAGESKSFSILVESCCPTTICNEAYVSCCEGCCGDARHATTWLGRPALNLSLSDNPNICGCNDSVTHFVRVSNDGSAPATNITVRVELPAELDHTGHSGGNGQVSGDGKTINFGPFDLAPGACWQSQIHSDANTAGDARVKVFLNSDGLRGKGEVSKEESTQVY